MRPKPLAVAAALALAATALLTTLAGAAQGRGARAERIALHGVTIHSVDQPIRVTAVGPIKGRGTAKDNDDPSGKGVLVLTLSGGKVFITNTTSSVKPRVNARRCTATITERGTFKIVRGTRRYAHATGSGTYVSRRQLTGARTPSGACEGRKAPPKAIHVTVLLTGDASVPAP